MRSSWIEHTVDCKTLSFLHNTFGYAQLNLRYLNITVYYCTLCNGKFWMVLHCNGKRSHALALRFNDIPLFQQGNIRMIGMCFAMHILWKFSKRKFLCTVKFNFRWELQLHIRFPCSQQFPLRICQLRINAIPTLNPG